MSYEDTLAELDREVQKLILEDNKDNEQEATLNAQIASLRLELARLRDSKAEKKRRVRAIEQERQSVQRKYELEQESKALQAALDNRKAEAARLLADAPWRDDAFPWQIEGALQLPERALLGDKRGLGKTFSSIIWMRVQEANKVLICLRKEVASDFIKELGIREPGLFVYSLIGATSEQRDMAAFLLKGAERFVVVTNIESWRRNIDKTTEDILKIPYDAIILDEAHHIKNANTGTAQGFFKLAEKVPKVLELTGTPIKNRPQEMFSLLHALYPHLFETERKFLKDYCIQVAQNRYLFSEEGLVNLVKKISAFYVARSPEDVGRQIPPPRMIQYKLDFESHPYQKQAYKDMAERSLAILNSGKVLPIISQLALMTRQAQMVSWPAGIKFLDEETGETVRFDVHESVKMDWAEDLIKELVEEGERIVFFSRFKPAIYELKSRLEKADLSVAVITGDEKGKNNTEEVFNDFDLKTAPKKPRYQVLLATYQTVGESANLNAAAHMVLYDRFWNPGNEDQAIGRVDRINSTRQATIHIPEVENSIDVYMGDLIENKRDLVSSFRDAHSMQASLTEHLKKTI